MAYELIERNADLDDVALVGIHTRGVSIAHRLRPPSSPSDPACQFQIGTVDITFHRDDVLVRGGGAPLHPQPVVRGTELNFPLEGKTVELVDDVLLHRSHDSCRDGRAAPNTAIPRGCSSPCSWIVGTASSRSVRTTSGRTSHVAVRARAVELGETDEGDRVVLLAGNGSRHDRHHPIATTAQTGALCRPGDTCSATRTSTGTGVERLLGTAGTIARSLDREVKKLPALRGRLIVNLFYESSTRTLSSFDLAAKRLSADTMAVRSAGSSVDKGSPSRTRH